MSFGSGIAKGARIAGAVGSRLLATDSAKNLTEWESLPLSVLASIPSGSLLGREAEGAGPVQAISILPESALPAAAARLNQAGSFEQLMAFASGCLLDPMASDPASPAEGQVWWRSGALWMRDASGVVPFIQAGTWTPALRPDTLGDFTAAYSQQTGIWVRVGRTVTLGFHLQTSSMTWTTASGSMRINGLPFASQSGMETLGTLLLRSPQGLSLSSTSSTVFASPSQGATTLMLYRHSLGSNTTVLGLSVGSGQGFLSGQNVTLAGWGLTMRIA